MINKTLAFVFPGQGSQSVGMLAELAASHPRIEDTFATASEVLGYDLWQLVQGGPETDLNLTHKTQAAMLAAGVACWRVWQNLGNTVPTVMAGHSLGEYTALVCAGALDFADAIRLVDVRGRLMQEAVPAGVGAMAAILGLDDDTVIAVCAAASEQDIVAAVNFNSPGQVVIAGHQSAVSRAITLARNAGAKRAVPLPVSVPSHCALMQPAALRFSTHLKNTAFSPPSIPVINNVDVISTNDPEQIRDASRRQLFSPVQWTSTILKMAALGVTTVIECGPGKVLSGLIKRIEPTLLSVPLSHPEHLEQASAIQGNAHAAPDQE